MKVNELFSLLNKEFKFGINKQYTGKFIVGKNHHDRYIFLISDCKKYNGGHNLVWEEKKETIIYRPSENFPYCWAFEINRRVSINEQIKNIKYGYL